MIISHGRRAAAHFHTLRNMVVTRESKMNERFIDQRAGPLGSAIAGRSPKRKVS